MTAPVLVLQHIACEPPAAYEDVLAERGLELVRVELDEGEPLPDWRAFSAIVVMGGPMGAYEDDGHAWLAPEKRALAEAVHADVPVWGVCLGAQLLAAALGARVYGAPEPEVGLLPVELTDAAAADPVFAGVPRELVALQWHGDTFDLPAGARHLARSAAYEHQAFAFRRAYGLQFHLEVGSELAREWAAVPAYAAALEHTLGPGAGERLIAGVDERAAEMTALARGLFERWLDDVAGLGAPEAAAEAAGA